MFIFNEHFIRQILVTSVQFFTTIFKKHKSYKIKFMGNFQKEPFNSVEVPIGQFVFKKINAVRQVNF